MWNASLEEWTSILALAHQWQFDEVKRLAVEEMEKLVIPAVEKAVLAQKYDVGRGWLETAYATLGARTDHLSIEDGYRLGLENVVRLGNVRERIREARRKAKDDDEDEEDEDVEHDGKKEYKSGDLEIVREVFHFGGDESTVGGGSDTTSVAG